MDILKPKIRIIHSLSRSGGTIICRCLGCMKNIILLSEINPHGAQWSEYNPLDQAHNWFKLLLPEDVQKIKEQGGISFDEAIELINRRCLDKELVLVIRDWSHLDFFAIPFLPSPSYLLSTSLALNNKFDVIAKSIVRHPIDQWLSIRMLDVLKGKLALADFLKGYLRFAEYGKKIGFIRFEDFTMNPEREMESLCSQLSIPFDPTFIGKWSGYTTITGDNYSERGYRREIKPMPRRNMENGLIDQFEKNPDYLKSIEMLNYGHPFL